MASASNQKCPGNMMSPFLASFQEAPAEDICMAPYFYTKGLPGKNTVARFAQALQVWFCLPEQSFAVIREVCEMTLTATLMLDDIEDGSKLRRGCPTASTIYGQSQTINSSNFVFIKGFTQLQALGNARLCEIFANGLQTIGLGQALELDWRHRFQCPRVDQYIVMVDNKTGGFFRLISQLMAAAAGNDLQPCFIELITLLGRYYQIRDDYQNLASDEYTSTKGFCDDLDEGKYSLPMIHLLEYSSAADHIRSFLLNRSPRNEMDPGLKKWILSKMRTAGTFNYTTSLLTEIYDKLLAVLENCEHKMGPNQTLRLLVQTMRL